MSNALVKRDKTIPETAVQRCFRKRCSENMQQTYRGTPMPKCDFNKVEKSRTSAWVFSSKFAAYFQNIFSLDHLWTVLLQYLISWCAKFPQSFAKTVNSFYLFDRVLNTPLHKRNYMSLKLPRLSSHETVAR